MSLHELDMAKRVSDHILCIDGRYVDRYGTPEEVFTDQYVSGLFGITAGSFDETAVSYTHLDVYKRQGCTHTWRQGKGCLPWQGQDGKNKLLYEGCKRGLINIR